MHDGESADRPQVVAHRGSSASKAEHTLAAYVAALDEGADALECDVRLTADGHLVCVHDRTLERTAQTRGTVSAMDLAQLEELDFTRWKDPWAELADEPDTAGPEQRSVLTLRKLLETVADYPRPVELAIETKHPTRYAGLVERRLVELLDEFGWTGADAPVRAMSFSQVALRRIRRLAPGLPLVILLDSKGQYLRVRPFVEPDWIAGPGIELVRAEPELIGRLARDRPLHVWTVNTPRDVDLVRDAGAEAIITDRPKQVLEYLGR